MPIYTEDRGIQFLLLCNKDLTTATVIKVDVKRPSAADTTWTVVLYDIVNGTLQYISSVVANELNYPGTWEVQPQIDFAGGEKFSGLKATFTITDVLE